MSEDFEVVERNVEIFDLTEDGQIHVELFPTEGFLSLSHGDQEIDLRLPYNVVGLAVTQGDQTIIFPHQASFQHFKTIIGGLP